MNNETDDKPGVIEERDKVRLDFTNLPASRKQEIITACPQCRLNSGNRMRNQFGCATLISVNQTQAEVKNPAMATQQQLTLGDLADFYKLAACIK